MKFQALLLALVSMSAMAADDSPPVVAPIQPVSINVSKRTPVAIENVRALKTYADSNSYYYTVNLHEGMRVLYSASYGIGGEAAQARGRIVERHGHFLFKQDANPSGNLLLPPGMTFNGHSDESLWDIGEYLQLINRVAFSDPNAASKTASNIWGDQPEAYTVDFEGGTAGQSIKYSNAMEVSMKRSVQGRSQSNLKVYYARGIGPVALEFREDMTPTGTFKFYLGD